MAMIFFLDNLYKYISCFKSSIVGGGPPQKKSLQFQEIKGLNPKDYILAYMNDGRSCFFLFSILLSQCFECHPQPII